MNYYPTQYKNVYIIGTGNFLPGQPINNDQMDDFVAPVNGQSKRIKRRVLADNGIQTRYYAINADGSPRYSAAEMGAAAITQGLQHAGVSISDITLLATATSGADVLMPGFANMLQGQLHAPPLETRSHHGICASGVAALKDAANHIDNGSHSHAAVVAVEYPSRLFKRSRYKSMDYELDFDAHFLRWMLSDGAGACVLSAQPNSSNDVALRVDWIHTKSFSGDYPVCMQMGLNSNDSLMSFMDYASFADAEAAGALALRQDIRLLPQLFEVAVHEYAQLVKSQYIVVDKIDHFLSHYSSEKLGGVCDDLMQKAGLGIPRAKWFSNLVTCGNTGSASIFIMLADLMRKRKLNPGEKIFCFVPESGRFTVSYMMLTVVAADTNLQPDAQVASQFRSSAVLPYVAEVMAPHDPNSVADASMRPTLQALAAIWHDYRSNVWRMPLVKRILSNDFTRNDYLLWMENWIPQVQEGSKWMRQAIDNLPDEFTELHDLIHMHAGEEQNDFMLLFKDYRDAGGHLGSIDDLRRNPGGEALNAYMHRVSSDPLPVGLLGGIYIIEGTGQRIIPALLPSLRKQLDLPDHCFRFLKYHGENDLNHLTRWLQALSIVLSKGTVTQRKHHADLIVKTARHVAGLYLLQWEYL